jgi:hypothetical protein
MTKLNKPAKPRLTDTERYKRFLDAAKEVGASDDPKDFERAFMSVAAPKPVRPHLKKPSDAIPRRDQSR